MASMAEIVIMWDSFLPPRYWGQLLVKNDLRLSKRQSTAFQQYNMLYIFYCLPAYQLNYEEFLVLLPIAFFGVG